MAYLTQYATANDADFLKRVTMAMLDFAHDVATEDPATNFHLERLSLSIEVYRNPGSYAQTFSLGICAFSPLTGGSTDQNIKDAVASVWNSVAGV